MVFLNDTPRESLEHDLRLRADLLDQIDTARKASPFLTWEDVETRVPGLTASDCENLQRSGVKLTSRTFLLLKQTMKSYIFGAIGLEVKIRTKRANFFIDRQHSYNTRVVRSFFNFFSIEKQLE